MQPRGRGAAWGSRSSFSGLRNHPAAALYPASRPGPRGVVRSRSAGSRHANSNNPPKRGRVEERTPQAMVTPPVVQGKQEPPLMFGPGKRDVPNKTWTTFEGATSPALVTARITKTPTLESLVELLGSAPNYANFNTISLSAAITRLGKLTADYGDKPLPTGLTGVFERLVAKIELIIPSLDGRAIANVLHSVAVSGFFLNSDLIGPTRRLCVTLVCDLENRQFMLDEFKPLELSNILWSLARMDWDCLSLYSRIFDFMVSLPSLSDYEIVPLSSICWSMGKLGVTDASLLDRIASEYLDRGLARFSPGQISSLCYALSVTPLPEHAVVRALMNHLDDRELYRYDWLEISNLVRSFAVMLPAFSPANVDFIDRLIVAFRMPLRVCDEEALAITAWSMAYLCLRTNSGMTERFFTDVATACVHLGLEGFSPRQLVNLVWAFAECGVPNPRLFESVADSILRRGLSSFVARDLSYLLWSFATLENAHVELQEAIVHELLQRNWALLTVVDLTNVAWSAAALGMFNAELLGKVAEQCIAMPVSDFSAQDVANLVWSMACSQLLREPKVQALMAYLQDVPLDRTSMADAVQLTQTIAAWKIEVGEEPGLPLLLAKANEAPWTASLRDSFYDTCYVSTPSLQLLAWEVTKVSGNPCSIFARSAHGLVVDLLVTLANGQSLAIDLDSRPKLFINESRRTGATIFHRRLLNKSFSGFVVASVREWCACATEEARARFVRGILGERE